MERSESLKALFEKVAELSDSTENKKILSRWIKSDYEQDVGVAGGASVWHGVPAVKTDGMHDVPFTVDPEIAFWSRLLGFDMKEFYTDPMCYLENQLKMKIYRHERFFDDTCITRDISVFLGVTLEPGMFGVETVYSSDRDPWNSIRRYIVKDRDDLSRLVRPDFFRSGLMPLAHRFYEEIGSVLPKGFSVTFPLWGRGPLGVAEHLMGLEVLALDIALDPSLVIDLFRFITDCNKDWLTKRASFLNQKIKKGVLYNDEVNCQVISPDTYRDLVFPFEKEIAEYQGGITYWHSCGNTTPILRYVKQLKGLELYDSSAWCDFHVSAAELKDTGIAMEIRQNPVSDVLYADEASIRRKLADILYTCRDVPITVRADGMQSADGMDKDMEHIRRWADTANIVLRRAST
jgi:hypothetical protein